MIALNDEGMLKEVHPRGDDSGWWWYSPKRDPEQKIRMIKLPWGKSVSVAVTTTMWNYFESEIKEDTVFAPGPLGDLMVLLSAAFEGRFAE